MTDDVVEEKSLSSEVQTTEQESVASETDVPEQETGIAEGEGGNEAESLSAEADDKEVESVSEETSPGDSETDPKKTTHVENLQVENDASVGGVLRAHKIVTDMAEAPEKGGHGFYSSGAAYDYNATHIGIDKSTQQQNGMVTLTLLNAAGKALGDAAELYTGLTDSERSILQQLSKAMQAYADGKLTSVTSLFLSRLSDDTAEGFITFLNGLAANTVSRFLEGFIVGGGDYGFDKDGVIKALKTVVEGVESPKLTGDGMHDSGFHVYEKDAMGYMVTDYLLVRIKAIFAELEIRKMTYVGGNYIFSHAGSTIIPETELPEGRKPVEEVTVRDDEGQSIVVGYKCFFKADDGTTRTQNMWHVGDMALCQTFGVKEGVYKNVSNRYYWRMVTAVGSEDMLFKKVDGDGETETRAVDYVVLSNEDTIAAPLTFGGRHYYPFDKEGGKEGLVFIGKDPMSRQNANTKASNYEKHRSASQTKEQFGLAGFADDAPQGGDVLVQVGCQADRSYNVASDGTETLAESGLVKERGGVVEILTEGIGDEPCPAINIYSSINNYFWARFKTIQISADGIALHAKYFRQIIDGDAGDPVSWFNYRGEWDSTATYTFGDVVTYNGQSWVWNRTDKDSTPGEEPSAEHGWSLAASRGETQYWIEVFCTYSASSRPYAPYSLTTEDDGKASTFYGASTTWYRSEPSVPDDDTRAVWKSRNHWNGRKWEGWTTPVIVAQKGKAAETYEIDPIRENASLIVTEGGDASTKVTFKSSLSVDCAWSVYKRVGGERQSGAVNVNVTAIYDDGTSKGLSVSSGTTPTVKGDGGEYTKDDTRKSLVVTFSIGGQTIGVRTIPIQLAASSYVFQQDNVWQQVSANKDDISTIRSDANSISLKVDDIKSDLLATGIDIDKKTVTMTGSQFLWRSNSGEQLMYLDGMKAVFKGDIYANGGQIGGFNISGSGLTNGPGFDNDAYVVFRNDSHACFAGIGGNVTPTVAGNRAVARFENEDTSDWFNSKIGYNIAMYLSAKNAKYNFAYCGSGNGVLNGSIIGFGYNSVSVPKDKVMELDLSEGTQIYATYSSNSGVALPTLDNMLLSLGLGSNTESASNKHFSVEIRIIHLGGSDVTEHIYGRNSSVKNTAGTAWMASTQYPQLYDNNMSAIDSIKTGIGDAHTIMLFYDGSSYRAFRMSYRD